MKDIQDIVQKAQTIGINRRDFLKKSAIITGGALIMPNALFSSSVTENTESEKILHLKNTHNSKIFDITFQENGYYLPEGLNEVNRALMDTRAEEIMDIDLRLVNLLHDIKEAVCCDREINIFSGYRSPKTNNNLRRRRRGVAKKSYHMLGQAVDINMPGVPLRLVREAALKFNKGGVGYYPRSNFVHIDVGPSARSWRG